MIVAFARLLREELAQEKMDTESGLLRGVKDWDEYNRLVGKRQGIEAALGALDETSRKFDAD